MTQAGRIADRCYAGVTRGAGAAVPLAALALVAVLVSESWPVLTEAGRYRLFTSAEWSPKPPQDGPPVFGSLAFIYGTVVTSLIAMMIAVPLGVASAAFLAEIAPARVRRIGTFLVQLLAAIPGVIYGFWGLFVLAPLLQTFFTALGGPNTGGTGLLATGLVLAIMIVPYITAISLDACRAVPRSQRDASLALGATRWQTIRDVVLPHARPGILAAVFLALGRALGETMAVTMLIGNTPVMEFSLFATGDSIASKIANTLNEADDRTIRSALISLALVLLVVTSLFNFFARLLLKRLTCTPKPPLVEPLIETPPRGTRRPVVSRTPTTVSTPNANAIWNRVMIGLLGMAFLATVVPLFLILGQIAIRGANGMESSLFTRDASRPELTNHQYEHYRTTSDLLFLPLDDWNRPLSRGGLGHAMLGSLMIVGLASLVAIPIALLVAIGLAEARDSAFAASVRFVTDLLNGVPSIVFGIFAFTLFVLPSYTGLRGPGARPLNYSAWAGAAALALIMIPVIVRTAEEALRAVPESLRQASFALGASRLQTMLTVSIPVAWPAIVTSVLLAVGRVLGETAPLLLAAGYSVYWPATPSHATPFLPGAIYQYGRSPSHDLQDQAWAAALVLMIAVMLLNLGLRRRKH